MSFINGPQWGVDLMMFPALVVFGFYSFLMFFDEFRFHRKRGLSRRERIGRPLDTFTLAAISGWALLFPFAGVGRLGFYLFALTGIVSLFKDEEVHSRVCDGGEQLVHSLRYFMHPIMLATFVASWMFIDGASFFMNMVMPFQTTHLRPVCTAYFVAMSGLCIYQTVYWNLVWKETREAPQLPATESNPPDLRIAG